MSGSGQQIDIDLEAHLSQSTLPSVAGGYPHRMHSRSASWSFTHAAQRSAGTDLGSSLAALNPLQGVTSVIRELVGQESDHSSPSSPRISRTASQVSLPLARGPSYDDELSNSPPRRTLDVRQDHRARAAMEAEIGRARQHQQLQTSNEDQQNNIGFEISDGIRWLEHNAIFIILLVIKFAWYHRSGNHTGRRGGGGGAREERGKEGGVWIGAPSCLISTYTSDVSLYHLRNYGNTDFIIQTLWPIKCATLKSVSNALGATSLPRSIQNCSESYGRRLEDAVYPVGVS